MAYQFNEESYASDLEDNESRIVHGVHGVNDKKFKRKFKSQEHQDKYFDHPNRKGNYKILQVHKEENEKNGSKILPENDQLQEDKDLLNETAAIETIRAKPSGATGVMKTSMVKDMIEKISGMSSSEQEKFYDKMMSQYGKNKDLGVPDGAASKNKKSISGKSSPTSKMMYKEDLKNILGTEENLSEEFKEKAATLFEAAVNIRVVEETAKIREELEEEYSTNFEESIEEITEQVDAYLSYATEEWVDKNAVAIENNLKTELSESFIDGLQMLFAEHYMDIPEEQIDTVSALSERVGDLEGELNEQVNSNMELIDILEKYNAEEIFDEMSEGLALTQIEKFRKLTEGIDYDGNDEEYAEKLGLIREQYFETSSAQSTLNEEVKFEDEDLNKENTEDTMLRDDNVIRYAQAISRTLPK